jgi:RNA polymerase sigma factor (sigma-70 family)
LRAGMSAIAEMLKKARSVVRRRGVARDDADDVVQEAFARLAAYTRAHELRSEEAFLVNAAVNISRDQARRSRKAPFDAAEVDFDLIADSAPQPEEVVRARERLRRAAAGLDRLNPRTRRILLAYRLDGIPLPELARREGLSVAATEKQVARAVMFLIKWMDGW